MSESKVNAADGDQCEYCGVEFGQDEPAYISVEDGRRIIVCASCHDAQEKLLNGETL